MSVGVRICMASRRGVAVFIVLVATAACVVSPVLIPTAILPFPLPFSAATRGGGGSTVAIPSPEPSLLPLCHGRRLQRVLEVLQAGRVARHQHQAKPVLIQQTCQLPAQATTSNRYGGRVRLVFRVGNGRVGSVGLLIVPLS